MLEIYNNIKEMVLGFKDDKLCFINESAQYYFKSYAFILYGRDISEFIKKDSLDEISSRLVKKEDFSEALILTDEKEHKFDIKFLTDRDNKEIVLYINSDLPRATKENILRSAAPKKLYDPLKIGKTEIYKNHISAIADKGVEEIDFLLESAIIKRNSALSESVRRINGILTEIVGVSHHIIDELTTPDGKLVFARSVFSLNDMLSRISERVNNYIKMENLDITFSYTSREKNISISAAYYNLVQAVSGIIYNSCNYVLASGRKGRIGVRLYTEDNTAVIEITDNGIGLSKTTFEGINEEEKDISFLTGEAKKEFLNLRVISSYIRINNGDLILENLETKGSKAVIKLPLLSSTYSALRQTNYMFGLEDEIDKILKNGIIHM